MGLFNRTTAAVLDRGAAVLHRAGSRVAGARGGRAADVVATAVFGRLRAACGTGCTRPGCTHR